MPDIKMGYLTSGGSAINVDCGWVPDFLIVYNKDAAETENAMLMQFPGQDDGDCAALVMVDGATADGTHSIKLEDTNGPSEYDSTKIQGRKWEGATAYVVGDIVIPTTYNGYAYKCTSAGTSSAAESEPTWSTTVGGSTTDNGATWETIEDVTYNDGFEGFTIPAAFSDDGDVLYYVALRADKVTAHGDVG